MDNKINILFYLRTNYIDRYGKNAIMVKIGYRGIWKSLGATGMHVLHEEWDSYNKKVKGKSQQACEINSKLRLIARNLTEIAEEVPACDDYINNVKDIYLGKELRESDSFFKHFDKFLDDLKVQIGKGKTRATYQKYLVTKVLMKRIEAYWPPRCSQSMKGRATRMYIMKLMICS